MSRIIVYLIGFVSIVSLKNNPCTSTISAYKDSYLVNEPINISYKIKNVSKDTVNIWHCGFWCNNQVVVTDTNNIEILRTDWGVKTLNRFSPGGPRDKNFPIQLAPEEIDSAYGEINLRDLYKFEKSGTYKVTFFYQENDENGEIKIKSNVLSLQISK